MEDLAAKSTLANQVRDFCKHPVFAQLQQFLTEKVTDSRHQWLRASDEEAAILRHQSKAYLEIETFLKRLIIEGDNAARKLAENADEV